MTVDIQITKSKKSRNYMELPTLYFVAMDDWVDKLGEGSFLLYLKLWTYVDRTDSEDEVIRTRTSKLITKLNMSKSKYLRLIQPLYEYGLVDLVEYEGSKNEGSKPINIIVHEYPQNEFVRATMELEKCRSWKQRIDEKYNFSKQGGRPKKDSSKEPIELPTGLEEVVGIDKPVELVASEIHEDVNKYVKSEFEHFKEAMIHNDVDLNVLVSWVNKNRDYIHYNQMCYVFKQLSTYAEPIINTASFINSTLKKEEWITYRPITEIIELTIPKEETTTTVEFYDWLNEVES